MDNKKRIIRFAVPLVLIILVVGTVLVFTGVIKNPFSSIPILQKKVTVELKTTYKNPFNKDTQYVNPFDKYKNPFVTNR